MPSHRYPSGVCAIERIAPLVNPSRTLHPVCAYWLMSSDGSRAKAQAHHASTMPATMPALRRALRMSVHLSPDRKIRGKSRPPRNFAPSSTMLEIVPNPRMRVIDSEAVILRGVVGLSAARA